MPASVNSRIATRLGRRDALRIGGLTVSLAAIVAACGDDRGGDTDPGRSRRRSADHRTAGLPGRRCRAPANCVLARRVDAHGVRGDSRPGSAERRRYCAVRPGHREPSRTRHDHGRADRRRWWRSVAVHEPVDGGALPRADRRCDRGQRQPGARHLQRRGELREPRRGDVPAVLGRADRARAAHRDGARLPRRTRATPPRW